MFSKSNLKVVSCDLLFGLVRMLRHAGAVGEPEELVHVVVGVEDVEGEAGGGEGGPVGAVERDSVGGAQPGRRRL
jgi:hypothetical protein